MAARATLSSREANHDEADPATRGHSFMIFQFGAAIWSARATGFASSRFASRLESVARGHQGTLFGHDNVEYLLETSQATSLVISGAHAPSKRFPGEFSWPPCEITHFHYVFIDLYSLKRNKPIYWKPNK